MNQKTLISLVVVLLFIGGILFYLSKTSKEEPMKLDQNALVGSKTSTELGEYLTDTKGMTLYIFMDDQASISNCTGDCSKEWPAYQNQNKELSFAIDALSKQISIIKRTDSPYEQYAYLNRPLYYYVGDTEPGDIKGHGMGGGKWSVVLLNK